MEKQQVAKEESGWKRGKQQEGGKKIHSLRGTFPL